MTWAAKLFAIASLLSAGVVAHATGQSVADDSRTGLAATEGSQPSAQLLRDAWKPQFALGLRGGLFPPIFVIPEVTYKPAGPIAMNFSALYLPSGGGLGGGGPRLTLGTHLTAEFAEPAKSGWYCSAGAVYYHAFRDANGFYETVVLVPITAGVLARTPTLDVQIGAGVQLLSENLPPCSGWCFRIMAPPILPALDLVFRHVF